MALRWANLGRTIGDWCGLGRPTPSRTSQAVALDRVKLDRPHTPDGDPRAQALLCAGMRPGRAVPRPGIVRRTRFFDAQVLAALDRGVPQIVVLGAGYDDRALRFRTPGARFFELDHPDTQADKLRRIARHGIVHTGLITASADFRDDDVAAVLRNAGHDATRPTLFVCEGVLVYLDQPTITRLLTGLRTIASPDSVLAASLAVHADGHDSAAVLARRNAGRANAVTEPWRTILPADAYRALLVTAGWRVDDERSDHSGRALLAVAHPIE